MARPAAHLVKRRLCPDGRCIGLVGGDGRCRECGRSVPSPPDDWSDDGLPIERRMCEDGACFGILQIVSTGSPYRSDAERVCVLCGRRVRA